MPHVLVAGRIHPAGLTLLHEAGFTVRAIDALSTPSYAPFMSEADALMIRTQPLTSTEIAAGNRLRIVSRHGVGYDAVDVGALTARSIPLTIVGDVNAVAVAEQAFAMLLALLKEVRRHDAAVRGGAWDDRHSFAATEARGKVLLIVGFGRVGRLVAGMALAFGMRILAFDPFQGEAAIRAGGAAPAGSLEAGLSEADHVTLHLPKVGDRPLIGAAELALMKPTACLVNTARGGLIDDAALRAALDAGRLRAAAIDVFDPEPPAPGHPLLGHEKVLLSPHIAGLSAESAIRMSEAAARNIVDFFAGRLDPALVVNGADLA